MTLTNRTKALSGDQDDDDSVLDGLQVSILKAELRQDPYNKKCGFAETKTFAQIAQITGESFQPYYKKIK
ncbi:Protein of unknown function [Cotesia congregata]|uniref:Uncharacterized protein n=1 Tax=Cotesia congregata TaxID=51543 RepID=A0A8J2MWC7_COTCN|nr:Protein of unknown function [Cotesia congregata]